MYNGKDETGSLTQQRPVMVKITAVEIGEGDQLFKVAEHHLAVLERHRPAFAQLAQDAVDVYRAQAKRVCQQVLRQRAGLAGLVAQTGQAQPRRQFQQEMRGAFGGIATAHPDQMSHHHRLVAPRRRQHGGGKARVRVKASIRSLASTSDASTGVIGSTLWSEVRNKTVRRPRKSPGIWVSMICRLPLGKRI